MKCTNEIAILDFGSQYTHLIGRRIRELGVASHIYHNDISSDSLKNAVGIILSGGPRSVVREPILEYDPLIFELGVPVLGLCYGHQLMSKIFYGKVSSGSSREYGLAEMRVLPSPIFNGVPKESVVWMSHGDHVSVIPEGFKQIAVTGSETVAAICNPGKNFYGFQFHPEVNHTSAGKTMLSNFVFDICGAQKNWTTESMLSKIVNDIKAQTGTKNVFLLVSGGVDSNVCLALLEKVLGKGRVYGLHVDSGLMRLGESEQVKVSLRKAGFDSLHVYSAEKEYLTALKNVVDPEAKRKIIGDLFLDIVDKVMADEKMNSTDWLLGQGTIYPDTIESGDTKNADKIKTHHNRVPRILQMISDGRIIEPIRELYKDEVRTVGKEIGLPDNLINRHPFPGPGLGIRCLCSDGQNSTVATTLSKTEKGAIYRLPMRSVGVQGDERSYAHPALIIDRLDAIAWKEFQRLSPLITNSNKDINRVLFLLSGDKEKIKSSRMNAACVTKDRLELLRRIDSIVNKHILNDPKCGHVWQMPVVMIPFGYNHKESIVLRPVESEEAMTVSFAILPADILKKITDEIELLNCIDYIFYDITNKPPGTIEWE